MVDFKADACGATDRCVCARLQIRQCLPGPDFNAAPTRAKGIVMAENKTKVTEASVESYFSAIGDEARRRDCEALAKLMSRATKYQPKMWGTSIVGFGSYHYKYESGREGDSCLTGFSSRKSDISMYLSAGVLGQEELLSKLGKHRMSKGCLYVRKLGDVDLKVLEQLVVATIVERKHRHDQNGD
jgi:Domain of unknown function (DU1801)